MANAADRLHLLYDVSRRLTSLTDLNELLRFATAHTRTLFRAEGCALLLYDRERKEFYFPPVANQDERRVEAQLSTVRFPADRGIAGWVLANDQALLVPDVRQDPRFYGNVDQATGMTTRALLCAPLRVGSERIGVITVVNPAPDTLTAADLEFLETLAGDLAVAHERVQLYERLRHEVLGLRQASRLAGSALLVLGVLVAGGGAVAHLAWALPVWELLLRPGLWLGVAAAAAGAMLVGASRRRTGQRADGG